MLLSRSGDADQQILASRHLQRFFYRVPEVVFNLLPSFSMLEELGRLHGAIQSNVGCDAHRERNIHQYAHHEEPLLIPSRTKRHCAGCSS